jgi:hypothetical protein
LISNHFSTITKASYFQMKNASAYLIFRFHNIFNSLNKSQFGNHLLFAFFPQNFITPFDFQSGKTLRNVGTDFPTIVGVCLNLTQFFGSFLLSCLNLHHKPKVKVTIIIPSHAFPVKMTKSNLCKFLHLSIY